jgi:hypothetical protein
MGNALIWKFTKDSVGWVQPILPLGRDAGYPNLAVFPNLSTRQYLGPENERPGFPGRSKSQLLHRNQAANNAFIFFNALASI